MITATFKWMSTGETGTILEWTKPGVHLTPYHMKIIRNVGFGEFDVEKEQVECRIEVDGRLKAIYYFTVDEYMLSCRLFTGNSWRTYTKSYSKEVCLK